MSNATNLLSGDNNGRNDVYAFNRTTSTLELISQSSGLVGDGNSNRPHVSADGRFVVFDSDSTNLQSSVSSGQLQVYLRDRQTQTTELISVSTGGGEGNGFSDFAKVSGQGRFVCFASGATDLVSSDTNSLGDIFVRDRQTQTTERVSITNSGTEANGSSVRPSISDDGRFVLYRSDADNLEDSDQNLPDLFVFDRTASLVQAVSRTSTGALLNASIFDPIISGDGKRVGFSTGVTTVVPGDTNGEDDVFSTPNPFKR